MKSPEVGSDDEVGGVDGGGADPSVDAAGPGPAGEAGAAGCPAWACSAAAWACSSEIFASKPCISETWVSASEPAGVPWVFSR